MLHEVGSGQLLLILIEVATVFISGILRGFTGFGFSLFSVPILSILISPSIAIPTLMGLQVFSGLLTFRSDLPHIAWSSVIPVLASSLLTIGIGAVLLTYLPTNTIRIAIGLIVLIAVAALMTGFRLSRIPGPSLKLLTGATSGLLNGMVAMGGPPLAIYFLSGPFTSKTSRASMAFLFMFMGAMSLGITGLLSEITTTTWITIPLLLTPLVAGTWVGTKLFKRTSEQAYRQATFAILIVVAAISLGVGLNGIYKDATRIRALGPFDFDISDT